jgi:hypothetical protein
MSTTWASGEHHHHQGAGAPKRGARTMAATSRPCTGASILNTALPRRSYGIDISRGRTDYDELRLAECHVCGESLSAAASAFSY